MDFSQLAMETIALSESMSGQGHEAEDLNVNDNQGSPDVVDDNPTGILYRVEEGVNTFCIRGISSDGLDDTLQKLEDGDQEIISKLKIDSLEKLNELSFFNTDEDLLSKKIVRQVVNRRFPYQEDLLCNLSDPGINWWMEYSETELRIFFSSNMVDRDRDFINLGPIGDAFTTVEKFKLGADIFSTIFPLRELSYSDKFLKVSCEDIDNQLFKDFVDIFVEGKCSSNLIDSLLEVRGYEIVEYLRTLSSTRSFWLEVTGQLSHFSNL